MSEAPRASVASVSSTMVGGYSLGSLGTGVFSTVPTVLLLYYCTDVLRIPAAWSAAIVLLPKIWSVVWDPFVGNWSDRTTGRYGRRRPFLAIGALGVAITFITVFTAPAGSGPIAAALWVAIAYFGLATFYSIFAVPYIAVPAEIAAVRDARARLVRARMTVAMAGVLMGGALAPVLVRVGGGGPAGYALMAVVIAAICGVAMMIPVRVLREYDAPRSAAGSRVLHPRTGLWAALKSNRFVSFALSYFLMLSAVGAVSAAVPYLVAHILGRDEAQVGVLFGLMLAVTTAFIPAWSLLGRRWGDIRMLFLGAAIYAAVATALGLTMDLAPTWSAALVGFGLLGVAFAATQVLPFTLLAHFIHNETARGGDDAGIYTGAWTAAEKLGLATGPALLGIALAFAGSPGVVPVFLAVIPLCLMLGALGALVATSRRRPPVPARVGDLLAGQLRGDPNAEAVVFEDSRWTYAELDARVARLARALLAGGVRPGDRVATLQTPRPEFLVALLATASIDAIWVGLNPKYRRSELLDVIVDAEPCVLLTRTAVGDRSYDTDLAALQDACPTLRTLVVFDGDPVPAGAISLTEFLAAGAGFVPPKPAKIGRDARAADPCLIVYTSGSTGKPKGAVLGNAGLVAFSRAQNALWPVQPLRILNYFPINHIGSVLDVSLPCLAAGGTLVFLEQFEPKVALELAVRERVTLLASVPSVFQMQLALPDFASFDLSAVQLVVWEGAALTAENIERLLQLGVPLATNYGMTESGSAITALPPTRDQEALANTVGEPFTGVEVRLVGEDGRNVPDGTPGEVWTRSAYNMLQYWRRLDVTAEVVTEDGYLRTGDLAIRRPDGRYALVGRIKEMIKSGGYNVSPREVEAVLESHPAVSAAAVVSVPDPLWQEVGVAYVTVREPVSPDSFEAWCRERLANYKIPKRVFVEAHLPLLAIGKIDKVQLRARALQALTSAHVEVQRT